ncbi:probable G-protein coupled receptor Mth-like 6 [Drosophila kikkawai]|uniref:Probable G-protein coupled receptor Mth-like 6 n=1 Tax=Drosophila kikkawai TaxID=30033 RepID=A0A6P4J7U7_DROKI|nr:probable G-protein coupled receptor Mth-like 6 [Drosophila kikkawai]
MPPQLTFFGAFIEILILQAAKAAISGCHFFETVNISSSQRLPNGSYVYEGLEVPVAMTGEYSYTSTDLENYKTVNNHLRGCVCKLKPCIWICCRHKDIQPNGECTDGLMKELNQIQPFLNVTLGNGSVNGSVLLGSAINNTIKLRGYDCLHPNQFSSANTEFFVAAFHGDVAEFNLPGANQILWLSEVFLILTIAVYLYVKKLQNLHGKCLICYLSSTFMFLLHEYLVYLDIPLQLCAVHAYSYNFFWMAKFTWLLSMSHQIWVGFTSVNRSESQHSFRTYSIFSWGLSAILTGVIFMIDYKWGNEPNMVEWIPGVGWDDCDLKGGWSYDATKLSLNNFIDYDVRARNYSSTMMIDYCIGVIIFVLFILKRSTIRLLKER